MSWHRIVPDVARLTLFEIRGCIEEIVRPWSLLDDTKKDTLSASMLASKTGDTPRVSSTYFTVLPALCFSWTEGGAQEMLAT